MAAPTIIPGDLQCGGTFTPNAQNYPAASIKNADISPSAGIEATKTVARVRTPVELFGPSTAVAAKTQRIVITGAAGAVVRAMASIDVLASDVSRTISIDIQRAASGGAYWSILSAPIVFNTSTPVTVPIYAAFSTTALATNDHIRVVVTVAGGVGTQALGLFLEFTHDENPS